MAVVKTKEICIYGLNSQRKAILELLQKKGVVEVERMELKDSPLHHAETAQRISQFDSYIASAQRAIEVLDEYAAEKTGFFSSREELPMERYHMQEEESEQALKCALEILRCADRIHENAESIRKIDSKQIALRPYLALDVPMQRTETGQCLIRTGVLEGEWDQDRIDKILGKHGIDDVYVEIVAGSKEQTTVWMVYRKERQKEIIPFIQEIGLQEPSFSLSHHIPRKKVEVLEEAKKALRAEIAELKEKIRGFAAQRKQIKLLYDHLVLRKEKYEALSRAGVSEHAFVLKGYVLKTHAEQAKKALEHHFDAFVELSEPEDPDKAPEAFRNNAFARPVEGITEMYSMPSATDVDPTPIMAFFYYFFFGMMFSDAGYGIMVMIACGLLGFGKFLEPHKRGMFQMFFFCGISTTFWGLMYGSFFGDAITVFSGGAAQLSPLWLDPVKEPLNLLIFSVAIGLIHVCVGLGVKFYQQIRQKDITGAVCDTLSWIIILGSLGVFAIGASYSLPVVSNIGLWAAVGGLVLLVATHGRHNKNIVMKIFGGILGIYDITSYIGDILSYSRLMALGLTTGVIASVVNLLGPVFGELLFGDSPLAMIIVVLVFIVGHLVNFAINMLGAYVHTNRLQYVEYFSKFYDGGGRKFAPFHMDTRYYRFSEKEH